ncbi:hypothetical protein BJ878DRAFT_245483 [Calycina marina]|uniref:GDS1 winged helix domain-containing protein n=1 Tax=Calycina marina TaxID=1763456 RepID=A0A9P8CC17_9HELO|nr:hypothetical protein BJ878DRAFT_245483 [Calycina marina]
MMGYNTRKKSFSLADLGIHVPVTHAERAAARLTPPSGPAENINNNNPPLKKIKRSHDESLSPAMSPPPKPIKYEDNTPPPSPEPEAGHDELKRVSKEISLEGINDEIVEGVILQLQKTANRPHLVKELAVVLSATVRIVEQSANPSAIISSRLATYLKRTWTPASPCPLAKELETVHPRRTYFYLTTYPHQPMPNPSTHQYAQRAIISPALSSAASRSDEADAERRRELSPSPEVDLTSDFENEDIDTPPSPSVSFPERTRPVRNTRASSPPLEKDEKEFTQTARGMQKRKLSGDSQMSGMPSEMEGHQKSNDNEMLFGGSRSLSVADNLSYLSSPAMKPSSSLKSPGTLKRNFEESSEMWGAMEWDMRSPECIELEELEDMLDDV